MDDLSKTLDKHNISVKATVSFRNKKSEIAVKMKTLKVGIYSFFLILTKG